ncbi:hypothetical protein FB480_10440 [Agrobacterium vitis]|nr:hypothetical protein FB480_10440 [Agrobacterium vitis]
MSNVGLLLLKHKSFVKTQICANQIKGPHVSSVFAKTDTGCEKAENA